VFKRSASLALRGIKSRIRVSVFDDVEAHKGAAAGENYAIARAVSGSKRCEAIPGSPQNPKLLV
jgi:hypothetical protein